MILEITAAAAVHSLPEIAPFSAPCGGEKHLCFRQNAPCGGENAPCGGENAKDIT